MRIHALGFAAFGLIGFGASDASAQVVADFEWSGLMVFTTLGDSAPPIDITSVDFRLTQEPFYLGPGDHPGVVLGAGELVLASDETGSVDLTSATDPVAFSFFASALTGEINEDAYLSISLGSSFSQHFRIGSSDPLLWEFSPSEVTALEDAEISFFRIIVTDLTIENGVGGNPAIANITSSVRLEVWVPTPSTGLALGLAGPALVARRRR